MTRTRPSAAAAMMRPARTSVTMATAGMSNLLVRRREQLGNGSGVTHSAHRYVMDGLVGGGQQFRGAIQLADQTDPRGERVIRSSADPLQRGEHPVEQGDEHGNDNHQQYDIADPPQNHDSSPQLGVG